MSLRPRQELDGGFTLIEILVAVAILGITFTALLTGLATITSGSDSHRKGSVAGTLIRQWAEGVEALPPITSCTNVEAQYSFATVTGVALPAGYTAPNPTVSSWGTSSFGACKVGSEQQILLNVKSSDARDSESLTIVKLQS